MNPKICSSLYTANRAELNAPPDSDLILFWFLLQVGKVALDRGRIEDGDVAVLIKVGKV